MVLSVNNRAALRKPRSRSPLVGIPQSEPLTDAEVELVEAHRADWEFAAYDILGWSPRYPKQADVLESVRVNSETYVGAANGVGKTDETAVITLLHTVLYRGIVITTATTWNQVRTVLWERMRRIAGNAPEPLPLTFNNTELKVDDGWFTLGLSTRDESRFAGYHEPRQMVVIEEGTGISEPIFSAIDGVLSGEHDKLFCVYNPLFRECALYPRVKAAEKEERDGGPSKVIEISAFDTPNVITGQDLVPGMVSLRAVKQRLKRWGPDDPRTAARIYGRWPAGGTNGLFPLAWLDRAFRYDELIASGEARPLDYEDAPVRAGQDVARYGRDNSAQALMKGGRLLNLFEWNGSATTETAGRVLRVMDGRHPDESEGPLKKFPRPDVVRIDADGIGSGVFDEVLEYAGENDERRRVIVEEWHAGARTSNPDEFYNFKAEAYWSFRTQLERGLVDLSALDEEQRDEVTSQALACGYKPNRRGQTVVEDKDVVRKKLGRSPDTLEAIIMAAWSGMPYEPEEEDAVSGSDIYASIQARQNPEEFQNTNQALLTRGARAEETDRYTDDEDDYFDAAEDLF